MWGTRPLPALPRPYVYQYRGYQCVVYPGMRRGPFMREYAPPATAAGDGVVGWLHRSWCLQARAVSALWRWEFDGNYDNIPLSMGASYVRLLGYTDQVEIDPGESQSSGGEMDIDECQVDSDFGETEVRRDVARELGILNAAWQGGRGLTGRDRPITYFGSFDRFAPDAGNSNMAAFE